MVRSPVGADPRQWPVLPEAVRKLALSICAWKVLLNLANPETKSAGDGYPKKAIEKTILRFLGSRTFSHGLDPKPSSNHADKPAARVVTRGFLW